MNIDIENIDKIENIHNNHKNLGYQSTKLYNKSYLRTLTFFGVLRKKYNNNANDAYNMQTDVKNNLKRMAMEKGFYAQVFMLRQKDFIISK